ncbi:hypothetical protein PR048_007624 [Dryococelus australis]|uniref:Uncharacterized protein n=1 Tax=Dryococelus australis TaxID=614101 RepID=A0ABQ9HUR8_9NEOP|nr:hypothetical protein PR048_007624 [Dryococelus australis]
MAFNIEVLRADKSEAKQVWNSAETEGWEEWQIPKKTHQPADITWRDYYMQKSGSNLTGDRTRCFSIPNEWRKLPPNTSELVRVYVAWIQPVGMKSVCPAARVIRPHFSTVSPKNTTGCFPDNTHCSKTTVPCNEHSIALVQSIPAQRSSNTVCHYILILWCVIGIRAQHGASPVVAVDESFVAWFHVCQRGLAYCPRNPDLRCSPELSYCATEFQLTKFSGRPHEDLVKFLRESEQEFCEHNIPYQ